MAARGETDSLPAAWTRRASVATALAVCLVLVQSWSLISRASVGTSDVGVFFRTAELVNAGVGAELYSELDSPSGWFRTIPPAGLLPFLLLSRFGEAATGALWAVANLGLLGVGVVLLSRFLGSVESDREEGCEESGGLPSGRVQRGCEQTGSADVRAATPWIVVVFVLLSGWSIQVGQFSLLFATCWIAALYALSRGRDGVAGLILAIPVVIKIYPALMLAIPLALGRRRWIVMMAFFTGGAVLFGLVLPTIYLGPRAWGLTESFVSSVLLGEDGRVAAYSRLEATSLTNQGLDMVVTRYVTHSPWFHDAYPIPHLALGAAWIAHGARATIAAVTLAVVLSARGRWVDRPNDGLLQSAALWSATLYSILPETKARYAVYTVLAFVPLCVMAVRATRESRPRDAAAWTSAIVILLALSLQALPRAAAAYGTGYLGSLGLWAINVRLARRPRESTAGRRPAARIEGESCYWLPGIVRTCRSDIVVSCRHDELSVRTPSTATSSPTSASPTSPSNA